jgi:hypothetical protein
MRRPMRRRRRWHSAFKCEPRPDEWRFLSLTPTEAYLIGQRYMEEPKSTQQQHRAAFGSVFSGVASELSEHEDFRQALDYIGSRMDRRRYRTITDFLFCELFGRPWPDRCRKFYAGIGPSLDECIHYKDIQDFQRILLHAMNLALINTDRKRHIPWCRFRSEVLRGATRNGMRRPSPRWTEVLRQRQ